MLYALAARRNLTYALRLDLLREFKIMMEFLVSEFIWVVLIGLTLIIIGLAREKLWVSMHGVCLTFIGIGLHDTIPILTALGVVGILLMVFILLVQHWASRKRGD